MSEKIKALDAHIHYSLKYPPEELVRTMDDTCTEAANLVIVPDRRSLSSVPDALMVKDMYPGRFYVFSSLDVSVYYRYGGRVGEKMTAYAKDMLACGCDGIKIIEGKPNMRKLLPVPDWDSPEWEPFFKWCENEAVPILWHVNDPEFFWDTENAPPWAKSRGWAYDESYICNEEQYGQILRLLEKFPLLKICFAHFFFMSAQLERLAEILDRFPNIRIDITPGTELYQNLSEKPGEAAAFFKKYGKRIIRGTDIGSRTVLIPGEKPLSEEESFARVRLVDSFLRDTGTEHIPGDGYFLTEDRAFEMNGLGLGDEALRDIAGANFVRFVGGGPRPADAARTARECRRIRHTLRRLEKVLPDFRADVRYILEAESYFNGKR